MMNGRRRLLTIGHSYSVAVNRRYAPWTEPLGEGDELVFIPPVAGG